MKSKKIIKISLVMTLSLLLNTQIIKGQIMDLSLDATEDVSLIDEEPVEDIQEDVHEEIDFDQESLDDEAIEKEELELNTQDLKALDLKDTLKEDIEEQEVTREEVVEKTNSEVHNVQELYDAILNANEDLTITLSTDFQQEKLMIDNSEFNIEIDAQNILWTTGTISFLNQEKAGSITLKNMIIDASSIDGKVISILSKQGTIILDNIEIKNSTSGAMSIATTSTAYTVLNSVYLHHNKGVNTGSAIYLGSNSNVEINYSTIEYNESSGGGYEGGAIASKGYEGNLIINNSILSNNTNKIINTGLMGGGGGAIAIHYFSGNIEINNSIFDSNSTNGADGNVKNTYDGGAIYIFDGRGKSDGSSSKVTIKGSTFSNNIAYDDGGAIMFQGTGNPGMETRILNSTFFNNKAYGLTGGNVSGGAIQFFKNGGSSKMINIVQSSTFVNNTSGNDQSKVDQKGGAIGLSGAGLFATAAVTRDNNLFIGNKVHNSQGVINEESKYKDISNTSAMQEGTYNVINVDGGVTPKHTLESIVGTTTPTLMSNQSDVRAGITKEIVKSIPIIPESIADNTLDSTKELPLVDQRYESRYKDHGSIEMSWIKYVTQEGYFDLEPLEVYEGNKYYRANDNGTITSYYDIQANGYSTNLKSQDELSLVNEGYQLIGYSTLEDHQGVVEYEVGESVRYEEENLTLYAIWEKVPTIYTITYTDGVEDEVVFDNQTYDIEEGLETPLFVGEITREGYDFNGWTPNLSATVTQDQVYTSTWTPKTFTVTYNSLGGSEVKEETVLYHQLFTRPQDPVFEGMLFDGWYLDEDFDYLYDFNTLATQDITLYAHWVNDQSGNIEPGEEIPEEPNVVETPENEISEEKTPTTGININSYTYTVVLLIGLLTLAILLKKKRVNK